MENRTRANNDQTVYSPSTRNNNSKSIMNPNVTADISGFDVDDGLSVGDNSMIGVRKIVNYDLQKSKRGSFMGPSTPQQSNQDLKFEKQFTSGSKESLSNHQYPDVIIK